MSRPRLKKFIRAEVADPLKLQTRDILLLHDVAEFRFLNTPQIVALHKGGKRNLLRRLTSLFQHGYLNLPPPHELADTEEREFVEEVIASGIGKNYLRERKRIEEEIQSAIRESHEG